MKKSRIITIILIALYFLFIGFAFFSNFGPGIVIGKNFIKYCISIIKILPFVFILIGLFEVWVKRETIEAHLGADAGFKSYFYALFLGSFTIGSMIVALPIAHSLSKKGARLDVVFTYVGAAAVCRIPMTIFEASYLGIKFTIIRYALSIPFIIFTSIMLGKYLEKRDYKISKGG